MKLRIDDMSCEGCARSVTRTIQRLDPEAEVAADGEALVRALAAAGYPSAILAA